MRHEDMALEIPQDRLQDLVPILYAVPEEEILRRRRAIIEQRARLVYDFSGSRPDAFSTLLEELEERVRKLRRHRGHGLRSYSP